MNTKVILAWAALAALAASALTVATGVPIQEAYAGDDNNQQNDQHSCASDCTNVQNNQQGDDNDFSFSD
jgi:hypothetical protein